MELNNDFRVPVDIDTAWNILTDLERIAPCMPGAQLQEVDGDEFKGVVKVKVGPITAQYKGVAKFKEKDAVAHKAVIDASGRDTRGQGNASALITAELTTDGDGTKVALTTDLTVTGKVAQFGRGVMADVSAKLLGQFVECLEADVLADAAASAAAKGGASVNGSDAAAVDTGAADKPASATGPRKIDAPEAEAIDLMDAAGASVAKRMIPVAVALFVLFLLGRRLRS